MNKWVLTIIGLAVALVIVVIAYRMWGGSGGKVKIGKVEVEVESSEVGKEEVRVKQEIPEECLRTIIPVPAKWISTNSSNTSIAAGDAEIDSNDWTSVGLSYSIRLTNGNRRVELSLDWFAQERNSNRSLGDTRFVSNKTFNLFEIDAKCPDLKIKELTGLDASASRENYYRGELRGFISFPDTGSLRNIRVQVDEQGKHDNRVQALEATLQGFSVKLE